MPLGNPALKFSLTPIPEGLGANLYDQTGNYNAITNTGGFGAPNYAKTDVNGGTITIWQPDSVTKLPDVTSTNYVVRNVFTLGFPVTSPVVLTPTAFGAADDITAIADGDYLLRLILTVFTGVTTVPLPYKDIYWTAIDGIICCKNTLSLGYKPCGCKPSSVKDSIISLLIDIAAIGAATNDITNCQDPVSAAAALIDAQAICACSGCGCSNC